MCVGGWRYFGLDYAQTIFIHDMCMHGVLIKGQVTKSWWDGQLVLFLYIMFTYHLNNNFYSSFYLIEMSTPGLHEITWCNSSR